MDVGVIDCDVHPVLVGGVGALLPYLSERWRRRLDPRKNVDFIQALVGRAPHFKGSGVLRRDATPPTGGPPGSDPAFMVQHHLNRNHIEAVVLLSLDASRVECWTDPDEAAAIVSAFNDLHADRWLSVDRRFHYALTVAPHDPVQAAAEIRRFGGTRGVVAVWLPMIDRLLGDRYFHPIYQAAAELGLPIILHPNGTEGDYVGSPTYAGGNPPTRAERYALHGEMAMSNLTSLIFEGIFERYRELKVVFTEFGWTWVPSLVWRLDSTWKSARREMPWVRSAPSQYVLDHISFTSEPGLEVPTEAHQRQVLDMMNAERTLLFSSDYPHWDGDEPQTVFKNVTPALKARIFRDNAVGVFGERILAPQSVG